MKKIVVAALACAVAACGSEWHLPFSNANPTLPSNISIGPSERRSSSSGSDESAAVAGPRNRGTRVWLVPVPAGDMLRMVLEPELWVEARKRIDVFSFYSLNAYDHPGFSCGTPCGPNTFPAFRDAVPGGMFKWLTDRGVKLALEAGAVKSYACTPEKMVNIAEDTLNPIRHITGTGASVSFVSLDEPFFSGTNPVNTPGFGGCALSLEQTAALLRVYVDAVHAEYPQVQIGFIEPYPALSADTIVSALLELERVGVPVPFLHIDMHLQAAVATKTDSVSDLRRIREFCKARGIPFGVIIFGAGGTSNEEYTVDAWTSMRLNLAAVGVTEETVFQSWAESEPGNLNSRKFVPDTVPESSAVSHTGQLLRQLEFMGVKPAP